LKRREKIGYYPFMMPRTILAAILLFLAVPTFAQEPITITAVGDIMMGTNWPRRLLPPKNGQGIFRKVQDYLKGDIVFGNLEGPLTDGGSPRKCKIPSNSCYEFRTPSAFTARLKEAGFNALGIANNHAKDFGLSGLKDTVENLKRLELQPVGGKAVATFDIRGTRVAVAGFSFVTSPYAYSVFDMRAVSRIIGKLKSTYDIVIVSFHAGGEGAYAQHVNGVWEYFYGEERGNVVKFAHEAIDAGADLVIGHGPHVLRSTEMYRGKLIAYSLGNFLTYERFNISGASGVSAILSVQLDPLSGTFISGKITPVVLDEPGIPRPDPADRALDIIATLSAEDFDPSGIILTSDGNLKPEHDSIATSVTNSRTNKDE
jgi:hypothetical protein